MEPSKNGKLEELQEEARKFRQRLKDDPAYKEKMRSRITTFLRKLQEDDKEEEVNGGERPIPSPA